MIDSGNPILNSFIGGSIMAISSSLHLYLQGKITGISGTLFKCISCNDFAYGFSFLTGMLFISSFIKCFYDPITSQKFGGSQFLESPSKYVEDLSLPGFLLAGFLVGFGAKMANGCTSGHGVCGLPRMSKRSIIAISFFMIFGMSVATIRYHYPFLRPSSYAYDVWEYPSIYYLVLCTSLLGFLFTLINGFNSGIKNKVRDIMISFFIGALFSFGLIQSGMLQRHVVIEFLTISNIWNIQLAFVLGAAVGINLFTFNYILKKIPKPVFKDKYDVPTNTTVDNKLLCGSAIFGIGWGLSGVCPGPAVLGFYIYCPQMLAFFVSLCFGMKIESVYDKKLAEIINKNGFISKLNIFQKLPVKKNWINKLSNFYSIIFKLILYLN